MEFLIHKYTVITEKEPSFDIPELFDSYVGELEDCYYKIKTKELNCQQFYLGHLIIKDLNNFDFDLNTVTNYDIFTNAAYFKEVQHAGPHYENHVDDSIFLCTGWNFPCIVNSYRTNNSLYGNLRRHRTKIFEL